jgi:N-acyl-D-amino-acid deacylase
LNAADTTQRPLDLIVTNGTVVDGTGAARTRADVGIVGDTIMEIGDLSGRQAGRTIDATGLMVVPGFIDLLHNSDMAHILTPGVEMAITQGVTTAFTGLCGMSMAPAPEDPALRNEVRRHAFFKTGPHDYEWDWTQVGEYLERVDGASAANVATAMGFDNLWFTVRGFDATAPSAKELARMQDLAREGMDQGAVGMSHGAGCASPWSTHEDVVEVAKGIAAKNGVYACHQRAHLVFDDPFGWIREGIGVAEEAGIAIHFVHFKVTNVRNEGREHEMLDVIHEAQARGTKITLGGYPYNSGGGGFRVVNWAEEGGPSKTLERLRDPETRKKIEEDGNSMWPGRTWVTGLRSKENSWMNDRYIQDIAEETGMSLGQIVARVVELDYGAQHAHFHPGDEAGLEVIMKDESHIAGSDAIYWGTRPHPRCFGTYGRYLGLHCREHGVFTFEECVRQMTSAPARVLGLDDRGAIEEGKKADIVILDEGTVRDRATYDDPRQTTEGIAEVIVNGTVVLENGKHTGATPGRALRRLDA